MTTPVREHRAYTSKVQRWLDGMGWTQYKLAKMTGMSRPHLWYCMRGDRPWGEQTIERIEWVMEVQAYEARQVEEVAESPEG